MNTQEIIKMQDEFITMLKEHVALQEKVIENLEQQLKAAKAADVEDEDEPLTDEARRMLRELFIDVDDEFYVTEVQFESGSKHYYYKTKRLAVPGETVEIPTIYHKVQHATVTASMTAEVYEGMHDYPVDELKWAEVQEG